jgi:SH3-like domain-containing protein
MSFFNNFIYIIIICYCFNSNVVYAKEELAIPRFVSIKSSEVNVRTGPNVRYPIKWVFIRKHEPVEITAEFEHWRKIRDRQGEEGWVHETMLSGLRYGIVSHDKIIMAHRKPTEAAGGVFLVEPDALVKIILCDQTWCKIQADKLKGWIKREYLWAIYSNETIK